MNENIIRGCEDHVAGWNRDRTRGGPDRHHHRAPALSPAPFGGGDLIPPASLREAEVAEILAGGDEPPHGHGPVQVGRGAGEAANRAASPKTRFQRVIAPS